MPAGSGRYPSGQRGQTVNLLAYAFGGSNPPLPTIVTSGEWPDRGVGGLSEMGVAPTRPLNGVADSEFAACGNSSAVERQPSKLGVAGSNPVSRSIVPMGLSTAVAMGPSTARTAGGLFEMDVAPTRGVSARGAAVIARGAAVTGRGAAGIARGVARMARGAVDRGSARTNDFAHVAQLAEHALGKGEVSGSIPDMGSRFFSPTKRGVRGR